MGILREADCAGRPVGVRHGGMRVQLVLDAAAVVVLLTTTALSVHKPRGITRYGWRVQQGQRAERPDHTTVNTTAPTPT